MDDYQEFYLTSPHQEALESMQAACVCAINLGVAADGIKTPAIKKLMIRALENMVWAMDPPRGQLAVVKVGGTAIAVNDQ